MGTAFALQFCTSWQASVIFRGLAKLQSRGIRRPEQAEHQQQDEHRQQAHTTGQVSKQGPTERIKGREREAYSSPAQRQVRPDVRQGGDCGGEIFNPRSNSSSSTICVHSASTCSCWFLVNLAKNLSEVLILGT